MSEYYYNPDQAGELRRMVQTDKKALLNSGFHAISILSGKGGVGKSNVAAGLSFALADFGKKVTLIDADLGMANLDIICGVNKAKYTIENLLDGSRSLDEILVHFRTSQRAIEMKGAVALLPGGFGIKEIADLSEFEMERLFTSLSELENISDYIIMDAGAGIHKGVLSFAYASEVVIIVTTTEPTSIRDAYGVIKSLGAAAWGNGGGIMLVVNGVNSSMEGAEVAERIRRISIQYLGKAPVYLGYVLKDDAVERSVKNCKVFYKAEPEAKASVCVRNLAGELLRIMEGANIKKEKIPHVKNGAGDFFRKLFRSMLSTKGK